MEGTIYQVKNKVNNKSYVGQSINNGKARFVAHRIKARKGIIHPLYSSMRKYGLDNFEFVVIENVIANSKEELINKLNSREIFWIRKLNTLFKNKLGYNLREGGEGGGGGVKAWNKGKPWNEETLIKIREAKRKQDLVCPPHTGCLHNDEQKKKISMQTKKGMQKMYD